MNVTLYSFAMAVFLSTVFVGFTHLFRRKEFFLRSFGIPTMLFLYGVCASRMVFPIEFPFTRPIQIRREHDDFLQALHREGIFPVASGTSILELALCIWLVGAVVTLAVFLVKYSGSTRKVRIFESAFPVSETTRHVLEQIQEESTHRQAVKICICPGLEIPMGVGIFKKRILLPNNEYSEKELYYILKHEYTHFCNHDLIVKMLVSLFCCVFWWNPAVYLLQMDVGEMLELKCDMVCTERFSRSQKVEYLRLLMKLIEEAPEETGKRSVKKKPGFFSKTSAPFFQQKTDFSIRERFNLIIKPMRKGSSAGQILVLGIFALLFVASYAVVVQPSYEAPVEDIFTVGTVTEFDMNTAYVLKHGDGSYSVELGEDKSFPIEEDTAKILIDTGYDVKEEIK